MKKTKPASYVTIDETACIGCGICMRECPTQAIRIRDDRSVQLLEQCIGCGECLRLCPVGAIKPPSFESGKPEADKVLVAIVSPVLYSQFPREMPTDIIAGLKQMGYQYVLDLSDYLEMFQYAAVTYIQENRKRRENPWPLISPVCPVVVQLIGIHFPELLPHILPLKKPLDLLLLDLKKRLSRTIGCSRKDIILDHITPCASKVVIERSLSQYERRNIDRAFGINSIYTTLFEKIKAVKQTVEPVDPFASNGFFVGGRCLQWGMSSGEIAGMRIDKSMAISGVQETISYLEKIDLGMFRNMEYIEFRTCPQSCFGGPLTVIDKYVAKSGICRLIKMLGVGRRLPRHNIRKMYREKLFFEKKDQSLFQQIETRKNLSLTSLQEIDELLRIIRGKNCGVCGAPNCRTFAEDVVQGKAELDACIVLCARKGIKEKKDG